MPKRTGAKRDELDDLIAEWDARDPGIAEEIEVATELAVLRARLRERRKTSGLTQAAVAARMGVTQAAVSQIERGADVSVSKLARYLRAIGIDDWTDRLA